MDQVRDKPIYLRQWIDNRVTVLAVEGKQYVGTLTNIVFDEKRLMYLMLDERICINYDYIIEVRLEK